MFDIITYSPLHMAHTGLALATVKAQGIALFDLSYCPENLLGKASDNLKQFLPAAPAKSRIGFKIPVCRLDSFRSLLTPCERLEQKPILVLSDLPKQGKYKTPKWLDTGLWDCWAEVQYGSQKQLAAASMFSHILVKGSENGGSIGEENTFVLAQEYLLNAQKPIVVQGSMGFHTSAACIAAGAQGIVLDDQLLGFKESVMYPWRAVLKQLEGGNTQVLPHKNGAERIVHHPKFAAAMPIAWGDPKRATWPIGQGIGYAASWAKKYKTLGRLFKALRTSVYANIEAAQRLQPLAEASSLAMAHGTKFPIVQGPMTRVSDKSAFVEAVAHAGALPFLALSMLSGQGMEDLLQETKECLAERPWGVGVLGFVPEELRQEQLRALKSVKPSFALVAGGTVDQVLELEQEGIDTYLHAPTASLLQIFLGRGCKRFVFEGRECGGHVGPLGSFTLWETVIDTLLQLPDEEAQGIQVLFAGGIHDAQSSMMVAAMSGSLAAKGVKIGVLMGTAYLFTPEVCASGAVLSGFQKAALSCTETAVIETGPGHSIRCIPTPFVAEFNDYKAHSAETTSAKELSEELEKMTLGRLRMASKGKARDAQGELVALSPNEQYQKGMFMVGQVAGMHQQLQAMDALHKEVSEQGNRLLQELEATPKEASQKRAPSSIAVVGMSTILPKASEVGEFWELVLNYQKAIQEVPEERWDWKMYYDQDLKTKDKVVSKWGGFIDDLLFDPLKFGIPPHSLKSISPAQLILLEAVDRALQHAGYGEGDFDKEHTSVIVGSDGTSSLKNQYATRTLLPQYVDLLSEEDFERLPEWNEESFAGILTNVLAGRVANRFNLGGANFAVDAACASSLTAIDLAIKELEQGTSKMVIAAGIDIAQSQFSYTAFSKTQALSPTGTSHPFDAEANGIVISEGTGVVLLKQLSEAERDGDTIYAVIKGAACSSDGKGLGLTAPRSSGQEKAFARAYHRAGFSPATLGYYEAHATGTAVGDKVELQSIVNVLKQAGALPKSCAIGSVKSLIGHTKTSAGVVGFIKAALSLHHKTLSPHRVQNQPLSLLQASDSPVCLREEASPWFTKNKQPRRAGVSAFGFGGTNTHVVLEEYTSNNTIAALGHQKRPAELFLFAEKDSDALLQKLQQWLKELSADRDSKLADMAHLACKEAKAHKAEVRLSIVARHRKELVEHLQRCVQQLSSTTPISLPPQIALNTEVKESTGKMAFLFPGQGAQHLQMARENAVYLPQMREAIEGAQEHLSLEKSLSQLIYPETAFDEETAQGHKKILTDTQHAQPAIGVVSMGYLKLLQHLGLQADAVAGHSYGEFTALYAAGMLSEKEFLSISETRGALMAHGCETKGSMAVVKASAAEVEAHLHTDEVLVANLNAPQQTVISGERNALLKVIEALNEAGLKAQEIEVAGPFHTRFFQTAQQPLEDAIQGLSLSKPKLEVYSNTLAKKYPKGLAQIKELLARHLLSPVRFADQITQMHKEGIRLFVEVGPKQILTGLVGQILEGKSHQAVAVEGNGGGLKGLLSSLGTLYTLGYDLNTDSLFEGRVGHFSTWQDMRQAVAKPQPSQAAVWINGGGIRNEKTGQILTGKRPTISASNRKKIGAVHQVSSPEKTLSNYPTMKFSEQGLLEGYQAYQKTMQQFLATQETMAQQFFTIGGSETTSPQIAAPSNWEPTAASIPKEPKAEDLPNIEESLVPNVQEEVLVEASETVSRERIGAKMMEIISERTGYPLDMLATDVDLEAELGIDSIKRIEILDKILKELTPAHEEQLQGQMQPLMRTKTIDAFLDIAFDSSLVLTESTKAQEVEVVEGEAATTKLCPRFVMQAVPSSVNHQLTAPIQGLYLITSDKGRVAEMLQKEIKQLGGRVQLIAQEVLASSERLNEYMLALLEEHPIVTGIIHCAPLGTEPMPNSFSAWKNLSQIQSKSLFQILRLLAISANNGDNAPIRQVVSASCFGGHFGRSARLGTSLPLAGSNCGLLKTLYKEWQGLQARAVDFDTQLLDSEMAQRLLQELQHKGVEVEVGYPEGERMLFQPIEASLLEDSALEEASQLPANAVVLATGGAKGITSEICKAMVAPGMTLVLAGRSEQIDLELRPEGVSSASFALLKEQGVTVVYHSVDLREEEGVKTLLDEVYTTYGRLDALIHGAGIIEDGSIDQKGLSSFNKVFDTKVDTSFLLYKYLRPESLKLLVFFGSVSGRFGNQGQTDYAAANEVLNRFAWHLSSEWKDTRILTINWGPWSTVGMASATVMRLLKSQGMEPIGPRMGCDFFLREIKWGKQETAEIIAGEGPWAQEKATVSTEVDFADIFNTTAIDSDGALTEQ